MSFDANLIRDSFAIAKPAALMLVSRFYEILWLEHPEARPLFAKADMEAQKKALAGALGFVVDHLDSPEKLAAYLTAMGERHAAYGTLEHHYDWVGAALLKALAEVVGEHWTAELERSWRGAYEAIAALMREGARRKAPVEERGKAAVHRLHQGDVKPTISLSPAVKEQIRAAVRTAIKDALQREIRLALDEELASLSKGSVQEMLRLRR